MSHRLTRLMGLLPYFGWCVTTVPLPAQYPDLAKGRPPRVLDARIGVNVRLGDDPAALPAALRGQAEPHLARSPVDPDLLLATFQEGRFPDGGAVSCGYAVSRDGGLSWRRALIPALTTASGGRFSRATDPVAGAGPQGDLYLQTLGSVQGIFDRAAVVVSRSTDQGATWSAPLTVFESTGTSPSPDKNWLAVQAYPDGANRGRLVSTWTGFVTAGGNTQSAHLIASISDDRGTTWNAPVNLTPPGTFHQGTQPLFLPDGSLVVIYITFLSTTNTTVIDIRCKRSPDGGRTFPVEAATVVPAFPVWDDPQVREGEFLPSAAVARDTGGLFVSYVALVAGTPRVCVTQSANQGATWTPPVIVSDQPEGISVMNATIAAAPDGRTVTVFYMDKRDAPGGRDFVDFYAASSFDGGATWQSSLRVSELSSELRLGPPTSRGTMLGDYFGLVPPAAVHQPFVAIWCDTRTGDSDPFVARLAPMAAPSFDAWRVARFQPADHTVGGPSFYWSDPDGDGHHNIFEYLLGTDPLVPDFGDFFAVGRSADGTSTLAWAQRPEVEGGPRLRATGLPETEDFLPGDRVPDVAAPAGLIWQTTAVRATAGASARFVFEASSDSLTGSRFPPLAVNSSGTFFNTDSRLVNLSTRGRSGPGIDEMIVGFVLSGNKSLLIRAAGPALAGLGVEGALPDPRLSLAATASDFQRTNDNWAQSEATASLFSRLGAFPFPNGSSDAALALQLGAQNYTVAIADAAGVGGLTLVEAYDADAAPGTPSNPRLLNLSTRGAVGTGANALIAGFVLSGTQPRRVLIRAIGPGLAQFQVPDPLADPGLTLYRREVPIAANDDWEIGRSPAAVAATARGVGAFPLAPGSLDAALLITLAPGAYTVVVSGADVRPGVALVEIYDAD